LELRDLVRNDDVAGVRRYVGERPLVGADREALMLARSVEVLSVLLDAGVDVNHSDASGITALHRAAQRGDPSLVETLLDRGADPVAISDAGWSALDWFSIEQHKRNDALTLARTVELLLEAGTPPEDPFESRR
jgi:ankyrin repeat protein